MVSPSSVTQPSSAMSLMTNVTRAPNSAVSNPGGQVLRCTTHNTTSGRNSILNFFSPHLFYYHNHRQNMFILKYFTVNTNFFPHPKCKQNNCFSSALCFYKKSINSLFPYNRTILKNINTIRNTQFIAQYC